MTEINVIVDFDEYAMTLYYPQNSMGASITEDLSVASVPEELYEEYREAKRAFFTAHNKLREYIESNPDKVVIRGKFDWTR